MYKLPPAERGRNILHERHKRETYDIHRKKVRARGASRVAPCGRVRAQGPWGGDAAGRARGAGGGR